MPPTNLAAAIDRVLHAHESACLDDPHDAARVRQALVDATSEAAPTTVGTLTTDERFTEEGRVARYTSYYGNEILLRWVAGEVEARGGHEGPCAHGGDCHLWRTIKLLPVADLAALVTFDAAAEAG